MVRLGRQRGDANPTTVRTRRDEFLPGRCQWRPEDCVEPETPPTNALVLHALSPSAQELDGFQGQGGPAGGGTIQKLTMHGSLSFKAKLS